MNPDRRIAIVAAATDAMTVDEYRDQGYACWGLNAVLMPFGGEPTPETCERWFQIHPPWSCDMRERRWAERCPVPLYAIQHYAEWPTSIAYPLTEARLLLGAAEAGFASSFAYAVALALLEGVTDLALLGTVLHLGTVRERLVERPNLAWWIGYAQGRGVRVLCEPGHPATPPGRRLYGWEYQAERDAVADYCEAFREQAATIRVDGP